MPCYVALLLFLAAVLSACGGGGNNKPVVGAVFTEVAATKSAVETAAPSPTLSPEQNDDAKLPGQFVDLAAIYGGPYPDDAKHLPVQVKIDYSAQGLPPAGGPHWAGACMDDPTTSPLGCGPARWGIYRAPWHAETLVHNLEHAGVVIWYNTTDQAVIDELESFAVDQLHQGTRLVLAPYPEMEDETVAITVWSRRDKFPASDFSVERLQRFVDVLYCRFDPEGFCRRKLTGPSMPDIIRALYGIQHS